MLGRSKEHQCVCEGVARDVLHPGEGRKVREVRDENQGELNVDEGVEQKCVSVIGCAECCV